MLALCDACMALLGGLPSKLHALKVLRDAVPDLSLYDGLEVVEQAGLFPRPPLVEPNLEDLLATIGPVRAEVVAIEAGWDGDTVGWGVWMVAVTRDAEVSLAWLQHPAGDLRVLRGDDRRPEAEMASRLGRAVAENLGVPFWFPAMARPDDDAVRFRDRARGVPCEACGLLLSPQSTAGLRARCWSCGR